MYVLLVSQVFDQLDADKSGELSRSELKAAMEVLGLQDQFNLDDILKLMDEDGNGEISIEEFKNGLPKEVLQAMSAKLNEKGLIEGLWMRYDEENSIPLNILKLFHNYYFISQYNFQSSYTHSLLIFYVHVEAIHFYIKTNTAMCFMFYMKSIVVNTVHRI